MTTAEALSAAASQKLRATIDEATSDKNKIPGTVFAAANKDGKVLFAHASGKRGLETSEPMTMDSVFCIFSCTKLITAIAAVQLVEQGKLDLDSADQAEQLCPEFKAMKILKGFENDDSSKPIWAEKKNRITLRMLLSHTAGFPYSFFNDNVRRLGYPAGIDEFSGNIEDIYRVPLVYEPGTDWRYGTNLDWAGIIVERASGLTLDQYFKQNIFEPLGVANSSFFLNDHMRSNLAHMHQRNPDGKLYGREHLNYRSASASSAEKDHSSIFCSGGAGLYTSATEYLKILTALLNGGTSPTTHKSILNPASVDLLFTNQIPQMPDFGRVPIHNAKPLLSNYIAEIYPQPKEQAQGWSFGGFNTIHPSFTGRGKDGVHWVGIANLFWWVDREKGVAGFMGTQVLPFGDPDIVGLWVNAESQVYAALSGS